MSAPAPVEMVPRLALSAPEVAEAIGISETKVYEMLAAGQLPSVRVGRRQVIPVAALARWLDEQVRGG